MRNTGPNPYLKTKILTASPEQLRLMLYDGAIRFCTQGREAQREGDHEGCHEALIRAQNIVMELSSSLNTDMEPELLSKLSSLYTFIHRLLVESNVNHDVTKIDEAIRLLEYERETWQLLIEKTAQNRVVDSPATGGLSIAG